MGANQTGSSGGGPAQVATSSGDSPWLAASPERLRPALAGCGSGALPANVALLRLAMEATGAGEVEGALAHAAEAARHLGETGAAGRLGEALGLWRANPQAFGLVRSVLGGVEHGGSEGGVAQWAEAFDRLAAATPEGGVALYALGNPDLLREATTEVVARLGGWGLLGRDRRVLEVGCGIGRLAAALSPHVAHVTGLDVSEGMIARARERCGGLANVTLAVSSGRDLAGVGDGSADLVLAADVFPYLVQAGAEVVERHGAEAARVLGPGGHLVILNYSYRGDPGRDREDVAALAGRHGFELARVATGDFALWDAATFVLRRP
jgi:SAM-dependent methyltransferase